jgi:hypothetical protein
MDHQPQIVHEANSDQLADPTHIANCLARGRAQWRISGAKQKG